MTDDDNGNNNDDGNGIRTDLASPSQPAETRKYGPNRATFHPQKQKI